MNPYRGIKKWGPAYELEPYIGQNGVGAVEATTGSIYSVWNQASGMFDYYEAPKAQAKLNVEKPTHIMHRNLGVTVDQAAWPLPSDAKKVGSGTEAIGRVATTRRGALGDSDIDPSLVKIGMLGLAGFLLWKYVLPKRRRR